LPPHFIGALLMATALTPVGAADRTQERALNPPQRDRAAGEVCSKFSRPKGFAPVGQTNLTQLTCSLNVSDT